MCDLYPRQAPSVPSAVPTFAKVYPVLYPLFKSEWVHLSPSTYLIYTEKGAFVPSVPTFLPRVPFIEKKRARAVFAPYDTPRARFFIERGGIATKMGTVGTAAQEAHHVAN